MARKRAYRHDVRCRIAAPIGCPKTDAHAGVKFTSAAIASRKYTADAAQPRFPEQIKRQAVQMRIEGASISAARVVGASATSVSGWVKKGWAIALERMSAWRTSGRVSTIAASTIALDEMWTYWGARKEEKRNALWLWTAVVEERDGSGWMDLRCVAETKPHSCACWSGCRMRSATSPTHTECMGRCRSTSMWLESAAR